MLEILQYPIPVPSFILRCYLQIAIRGSYVASMFVTEESQPRRTKIIPVRSISSTLGCL